MKNKIVCTLTGVFLFLMSSFVALAAGEERIAVPDGYINESSKISVETGDKEPVSIRVKLDHGAFYDITDTKQFSVNKNCTAYVKVKYKEETVELEKKITNFDGIAPKVSAYIKGEDLTIKISDDISGPKLINVDGMDYTELTGGILCINLKDEEKIKEYFTIYAADNAGNRTNTLRVYNPYYVGEDPKSSTDKSIDNPQSSENTLPTSATGLITSHTDEDGEDMMNVSYKEWKQESSHSDSSNGSKQFFTIKTKSDKTFYLVVDESYNEQTAYLLTEASENDLLNFVNYDGNSVDIGETTVYTIPKQNKNEAKDAKTEETEPVKETKKSRSPVGIILIAAIAGVGIYFYKFRKKDTDEDDENDEEELDDDMQDEV